MGNKIDLPNREVSKEEAEEFAKKNSLPYFESSAKEGININEAFERVVNDAYKAHGASEGDRVNINDKIDQNNGE